MDDTFINRRDRYTPTPPGKPVRATLWVLPLLTTLVLAGWWLGRHGNRHTERAAPAAPQQPVTTVAAPAAPVSPYWGALRLPTDRTNLLTAATNESFQTTATGNPDSGLFGTVRTDSNGRGQFHEGIDIRCLRRDRAGNPLDAVYAAADGTVAYANRGAGLSNYGKYILIAHRDPIGTVYTLYAHLAQIDDAIRPGVPVRTGTILGIMGHTSTSGIPLERAHLHFEVDLMFNRQFDAWFRGKKLKPDHGLYHGWNFLGIDPLVVLAYSRDHGAPDMGRILAAQPVAFELVVKAPSLPDFFKMYPALWTGAPFAAGPVVLSMTDNGVILNGRSATSAEAALLRGGRAAVLKTNPTVLGRNGRRLVVPAGGGWKIGESGWEWLELLLYPASLR